MPAPPHNLDHLAALIEAALAHAQAVGEKAAGVSGQLDQALAAARALQAHGGHPDEGLRVEELTTENDK